MPDRRRHRGPHPEDERLFACCNSARLQTATTHLSWLLSRNYALKSALKLVGDRFSLEARQRLAVRRCACSDTAVERRAEHQISNELVPQRKLDIDGFNVLTTVEAAMAGSVLLRGRDGCLRDMASVHGSYRTVAETLPALTAIGQRLEPLQPASCTWWLDSPVSNSGRLSQLILEIADRHKWPWSVQLVHDPDPHLQASTDIVVTSDSFILDAVAQWFDLASEVVAQLQGEPWITPFNVTG